ncbi:MULTISPECIES: MurR/RpiR family transcriptional regulator [Ensifer]|jgi:DNA-binding MurR/RpiR family transcriptional regulator|uniref:SIS domain-containing protein n=1 Tax=Ensifer canadensis TaxID=555315 RepID=A0AAW4FKQ3_9HYPH|nr:MULTISPECIES: MurR/RpiR family transcriptional regulator [Ensifer]MBM3091192.1 SIS domain-containing protein [Ensifer canadensis]MDP9631073.1 DNA-binding MurR/RpiR family transcriptional regulator [Ensifer adhaerens]NOV17364.1 MurR/RpiR family transcriptional regulator [Ensifer canadensis]UBI78717.1 MurR/RpiR family transcriptional regulator [Ensifer canadensis]
MTLIDRIKAQSKRLTEADQKLIATMLENRAEAAFLSGPQLSQRASVHEATVTRLAQKLGYRGFPDLRAQLQREVLDDQDAATRMRRSVAKVEHGDYLTDLIAAEISALETLARSVPQSDVDLAADIIFEGRRVFVFGQGHAQSVAGFLQRRLDRFGMTTIALTGRGRDIAERMVSMDKSDVVIALAFRKQPQSYAPLVQHARRVGARTILISDLAGPLMEPIADLMLAAPRGRSGSEFQTPTIPFAIVNGIVLTIAGRHEREVIGRLEKLSELFNDFD